MRPKPISTATCDAKQKKILISVRQEVVECVETVETVIYEKKNKQNENGMLLIEVSSGGNSSFEETSTCHMLYLTHIK